MLVGVRPSKKQLVDSYPFRHHLPCGAGVPGVTDILDDLGLGGDYSGIPPEILKAAGERGDRVHAAIADELRGLPVQGLKQGDVGYLTAWRRWRRATGIRPVLVEHEFTVEGSLPYGGTLDLLGVDRRGPVLADWKTRAGFPHDGLQTIGYREGVEETHDDPEVVDLVKQARRMVVELRRNGELRVHEHRQDERDAVRFRAALVVWHLKRSRGWIPEGKGAS